jgi:hypothetical protein
MPPGLIIQQPFVNIILLPHGGIGADLVHQVRLAPPGYEVLFD